MKQFIKLKHNNASINFLIRIFLESYFGFLNSLLLFKQFADFTYLFKELKYNNNKYNIF